jgi:hypothetical protein
VFSSLCFKREKRANDRKDLVEETRHKEGKNNISKKDSALEKVGERYNAHA